MISLFQLISFSSSVIAAAIASLESIDSMLVAPSSIAILLTGVPASISAAITQPAAISALESEFATSVPAWWSSLAPAAQSYILAIGPKAQSLAPEIASLQSIAGITMLGGSPTSSAPYPGATNAGNNTVAGNKNITSSSYNVTSTLKISMTTEAFSLTLGGSATQVDAGISATQTTSTSTGGAAQATGALPFGIFGAVGILGLAIVL